MGHREVKEEAQAGTHEFDPYSKQRTLGNYLKCQIILPGEERTSGWGKQASGIEGRLSDPVRFFK